MEVFHLSALLILLGSTATEIPQENTLPERVSATELTERLNAWLEGPNLRGATVGLVVQTLDGPVPKVVYEHQSELELVPASNIKLVTSAAALHYLGPDYRFKTEIHASLDEQTGVATELVIKGFGDPWLVPEKIWYLANRLYFRGLRKLEGDIIVDGSFFEGNPHAAGRDQDRTSYAYMAPAGALSVGFNAVQIHVQPASEPGKPARVLVDPISEYAKVVGTIRTVTRGRPYIDVRVEPYGDRSLVRVAGRMPIDDAPRAYWRRIDAPAIYAGEVVKSLLKQVGIEVTGRVTAGKAPAGAPLITLNSPRLSDVVARLNKHSNNFMASQVARVLGAEVMGAPGSWEKASQAIDRFLVEQVGLEADSFNVANASGLHDVNRLSAKQIGSILAHMDQRPRLRPEFLNSLAVAGGSGTLSSRMDDEATDHLLRAKTGTLSVASALSGYVQAASGENLAFSILVNNYRSGIHNVWDFQDEVGRLLARFDSRKSSLVASAQR